MDRFSLPFEITSNLPMIVRPLKPYSPTPLKPRIRTPATSLGASRFGIWTESLSPRGIDAAPHRSVACTKAECDNRPLLPDKVKRILHFPEFCAAKVRR
jgi:hypothetical protein